MNTKNNLLTDISSEFERELGEHGTIERDKFNEEAYAFYTGQIVLEVSREAKITKKIPVNHTFGLTGIYIYDDNKIRRVPELL